MTYQNHDFKIRPEEIKRSRRSNQWLEDNLNYIILASVLVGAYFWVINYFGFFQGSIK